MTDIEKIAWITGLTILFFVIIIGLLILIGYIHARIERRRYLEDIENAINEHKAHNLLK